MKPTTPTLASRAILVMLSISSYGGQVTDKGATELVHRSKALLPGNRKAGRYTKKILQQAVQECRTATNALRQVHYRYTLPFSYAGWALLPTTAFFEYMREMKAAEDNVWQAVEKIVASYQDYIDLDRPILKGLFDPRDYPTAEAFRAEYEIIRRRHPVPDAGHFVIDLEREIIDEMRREVHADLLSQTQAAQAAAWERLVAPIDAVVTALGEFGKPIYKNGKKTRRTRSFKSSLVSNLEDAARLVPLLNLTGCCDLERFAARLSTLARYSEKDLKREPLARTRILEDAKALRHEIDACAASPFVAPQAPVEAREAPCAVEDAPDSLSASDAIAEQMKDLF